MERSAWEAHQVLNLWVNIQQEQIDGIARRLDGTPDTIGQQVLAAFKPIQVVGIAGN